MTPIVAAIIISSMLVMFVVACYCVHADMKRESEIRKRPPQEFHLEFVDEDGVRWLFEPHIRITAYESALLLPVFFFTPYPVNRWPYIRKHNLTKHFKRKENEDGIQK